MKKRGSVVFLCTIIALGIWFFKFRPVMSVEEHQHLTRLVQQTLDDPYQEILIDQYIQTNFGSNYKKIQRDLLSIVRRKGLSIEESGYLFLPEYPAQVTHTQAYQLNIPLILQKDPAWRWAQYGTDGTQQLGENGCAIATLAMIESYYQGGMISPQIILDWSQNDYYIHETGTSWSIFQDFAQDFNYYYEDYGNSFESAMQAIQNGKLVVVSVKPGYFTQTGHILLIRGYDERNVYVNDPNDDTSKLYSLTGVDKKILQNDALNYWAIYR